MWAGSFVFSDWLAFCKFSIRVEGASQTQCSKQKFFCFLYYNINSLGDYLSYSLYYNKVYIPKSLFEMVIKVIQLKVKKFLIFSKTQRKWKQNYSYEGGADHTFLGTLSKIFHFEINMEYILTLDSLYQPSDTDLDWCWAVARSCTGHVCVLLLYSVVAVSTLLQSYMKSWNKVLHHWVHKTSINHVYFA